MPILVSRASDSAQNLLVSRRHDAPEHRFETVLRQLLQFAFPKCIHNKCSACEFCSLELRILPKTCWFLENMAYPNVTLRQFLEFALPKFIHNKYSACEFWPLELQLLPKTCWFLEGMAYPNVTLRLLCANFFNVLFQNSFTVDVLPANFGLSSCRFFLKPIGLSKTWRTRTSL